MLSSLMMHDGRLERCRGITVGLRDHLMAFEITMWVLCGLAALFLASRFTIRLSAKWRLMVNDYFLIAALPMLLAASGLLHCTFGALSIFADAELSIPDTSATIRLTAAVELLWVTIYSVKICFLAQFKFFKPPYAYVNVHLTRYYWATVGLL
ncbi:hypothetical protein K458DRAFT_96349 [Lentithecium fluviatile CBS 122367]|uniref:Uncharacterized protein n=1 Tax=Lentithecium fluviatile CBS 122367 TaxID=1168545 RepID=A0A6G1JHH6_9PLEO|nr:hypothetical protein K458DRAFT_96349 [Lentithecium fluviatile CBS 122367]